MAAHRKLRAAIALLAGGAAALAGCGGASLTKVGPRGRSTTVWANGPIAYERYAHASQDDSTSQIFLRMPGGAVRPLTHVRGGAFSPAWSPDGTRIAFERGAPGGGRVIYTVNADGSGARPLAGGCKAASRCLRDIYPAYSPDGRRVSFERIYGPMVPRYDRTNRMNVDFATRVDLMVVDAHGGAPKLIGRWGIDPQPWEGAPRWSPDGRSLVLPLGTFKHPTKHTVLGNALFVLDVAGGGPRRISPWPLGAANPDWSPDGRRIVFNSEGGHSHVTYVVHPDGSGLTRLLAGGRLNHLGNTDAPAWSPDGKQIVFASQLHSCGSLHIGGCRNAIDTLDLFVMNPDGTHVRAITSAPQFEGRPVWGRARAAD